MAKTWLDAGFSDDSFVGGWKDETREFLNAATTSGLKPKIFVARDIGGIVVGTVVCQIWSGPIPWVVQPEVFRLGSLWGLHIAASVKCQTKSENLRQELLRAAMEHLKQAQCSKVVTLASSPNQREEMMQANVGLTQANMLTLDLSAEHGWKTVVSEKMDNKKFSCGPAYAEHDKTVCSHWRRMWEDVGIPPEALLPKMEHITESFIKQAREHLSYQTFLARCRATDRVVGSISCQIWEGPFPKIVKPEVFQMGTVWAVYVDPAHRRQGLATELMKLAMQHLKDIGCSSVILIAASEAGQSVYERLGFHANDALVCDLNEPINVEERKAPCGEVTEEKKQDDCAVSGDLILPDLHSALSGLVAISDQQSKGSPNSDQAAACCGVRQAPKRTGNRRCNQQRSKETRNIC